MKKIISVFFWLGLVFDLGFGQINDPTEIDSLKNWWSADSIQASDLQGGSLEDSAGVLSIQNLGDPVDPLDTELVRSNCTSCDTVRYRTNIFKGKPVMEFGISDEVTALEYNINAANQPQFMVKEDHTFVIHAYFRPSAANQTTYDFGIIDDSTEPGAMATRNANLDVWNYQIFNGTPQPYLLQSKSTTTIADDTWYTFVCVVDSSGDQDATLYINGRIDTTAQLQNAMSTVDAGPMEIGRRTSAATPEFMKGYIRQVLFYRKVLTNQEVVDIHNWLSEETNAPYARPDTLFYDTFTDANGTDLFDHTPDIDVIGNGWNFPSQHPTTVVEVQSNEADVIAHSGNDQQTTWIQRDDNIFIKTKFKFSTADSVYGLAISQVNDNTWIGVAINNELGEFVTWKNSGGTETDTVKVAYSSTIDTEYTVTAQIKGDSLIATIDDLENFAEIRRMITYHNSETHGLMFSDDDVVFDDFVIIENGTPNIAEVLRRRGHHRSSN